MAKPVLKWVGGKRKLLPQITPLLPSEFRNYHDPFLGAAALPLHGVGQFSGVMYLSDKNLDLITATQAVAFDPLGLIVALRKHVFDRDYYLDMRDRFNSGDPNSRDVERAALFIYLVNSGYNGLCRTNKSGKFNVPFGKPSRRGSPLHILDESAIMSASAALQGARIFCADYRKAIVTAGSGDLVYLDPPYAVTSDTACFTEYTPGGFTQEDQDTLALHFDELVSRGCKVALSNANTEEVRALYSRYRMHEISRSGTVSSDIDGRGKVTELLICGGY